MPGRRIGKFLSSSHRIRRREEYLAQTAVRTGKLRNIFDKAIDATPSAPPGAFVFPWKYSISEYNIKRFNEDKTGGKVTFKQIQLFLAKLKKESTTYDVAEMRYGGVENTCCCPGAGSDKWEKTVRERGEEINKIVAEVNDSGGYGTGFWSTDELGAYLMLDYSGQRRTGANLGPQKKKSHKSELKPIGEMYEEGGMVEPSKPAKKGAEYAMLGNTSSRATESGKGSRGSGNHLGRSETSGFLKQRKPVAPPAPPVMPRPQ